MAPQRPTPSTLPTSHLPLLLHIQHYPWGSSGYTKEKILDPGERHMPLNPGMNLPTLHLNGYKEWYYKLRFLCGFCFIAKSCKGKMCPSVLPFCSIFLCKGNVGISGEGAILLMLSAKRSCWYTVNTNSF